MVAVLRRGPSHWCHVGRWDVRRNVYTPGAWMRARMYPQRCDLSPDGRWLCYFTLKAGARWSVGATYVAISRLPWVTALAAWRTCGTWTRGAHFVARRRTWDVGSPDEGDVRPCRRKFGLAATRPLAFAVEHRRGWVESADSPPWTAADPWDEARARRVTMEKPRPGAKGAAVLIARGYHAAFREGPSRDVEYAVAEGDDGLLLLDGVQWADWAADGRLLVATLDGRLQTRAYAGGRLSVTWEVETGSLTPRPVAPAPEAYAW